MKKYIIIGRCFCKDRGGTGSLIGGKTHRDPCCQNPLHKHHQQENAQNNHHWILHDRFTLNEIMGQHGRTSGYAFVRKGGYHKIKMPKRSREFFLWKCPLVFLSSMHVARCNHAGPKKRQEINPLTDLIFPIQIHFPLRGVSVAAP